LIHIPSVPFRIYCIVRHRFVTSRNRAALSHQSKKAPPITPRIGNSTGAKIPPIKLSLPNRNNFVAAPEPIGTGPLCITVVVLVGDMKNGDVSVSEFESESVGLVTVTTLGRGAETTVCVIVTVDATGVVTVSESEVTVVAEVAVAVAVVVVGNGTEAVVVSEVDVWVLVAEADEVVSVTDALVEAAHVPVMND